MRRRIGRGEPAPLVQIPVWGQVERAGGRGGAGPGWHGRAARRAQPGAAPRREARRRAAARGRGRRHGQDAGHHPADRVADRHPAGASVGDPRPHVHGPGRGRDAGPGGPAGPVRLRGHRDLARSTRSGTGSSGSSRSSWGCRRTSACCRGRRPWCSCGSTCSSSIWTSTARSVTRRGSSTRWRRCSRGPRTRTCRPRRTSRTPRTWRVRPRRRPRRATRPGDAATEAERDAAAALEEEARRQGELARAYARYQSLLAASGAIDFGDQVSLALRLLRESPAARESVQRALPVRAGGRVPGHEPGPGGARRAGRAAAPERDGGGRRRPVHLQVPGRRDQQHPGVPGAVPEREGRRAAAQLPVPRAHPGRGLPSRPPQRPGPPGGACRDRQEAGRGARSRGSARGPSPGLRERGRGGGLDRRPISRDGSARGRGHATSPSSSARTRRRTASCGRSTSRGSRGDSPAPAACTPARRSSCCSRSCARSRTSPRRWTSTRSRPRSCTGSAGRTSWASCRWHDAGTARRTRSWRSWAASRGSCAWPRRRARPQRSSWRTCRPTLSSATSARRARSSTPS